MSLKAELKQILYDLPLAKPPGRDVLAHFCEHEGIRIRFNRARTTWQSVTPCALRPWLIVLEPWRNGNSLPAPAPAVQYEQQ